MIVAIGLIGVFLSGFLLGATFALYRNDGNLHDDLTPISNSSWAESYDWSAYVSNPEATIVTGDVPPTWTEDALR